MSQPAEKIDAESLPDHSGLGGRWNHWWKRSLTFEPVKNTSRSKPGCERWYEQFWKPKDFSARVYELVRRLPRTGADIRPELKTSLENLLPYPYLSYTQRYCLKFVLDEFKSDATQAQIIAVLSELDRWPGRVNLKVNVFDPDQVLYKQIDQLKEIQLRILGVDLQRAKSITRNQDQRYKKCNYWQIELLDEKWNAKDTKKRETALKNAKSYYRLVLHAVSVAASGAAQSLPGLMVPTIPALSEAIFTRKEFARAVKNARAKLPAKFDLTSDFTAY